MSGGLLPGSYVGLCSCFSLFLHLSESISCGKVNLVYPLQKVGEKNSCSTLGGFKDRRIMYKGNKWCAFDSRAPRSWFFWLVVINHNFSDHPNSKADTLLWFHSLLSTWNLSFCHLLVDDQQKRKLNFLLSNFNWQQRSCNINVQGEHFRLAGHLYPLFRSLEFITRLLLVSLSWLSSIFTNSLSAAGDSLSRMWQRRNAATQMGSEARWQTKFKLFWTISMS